MRSGKVCGHRQKKKTGTSRRFRVGNFIQKKAKVTSVDLVYQMCRLEEKMEPLTVLNYPLSLTTFYLSITEQARFGLHRGKLYLERGPERYVLAWSASRAFSTTDGEETCLKRMLTQVCVCLQIQL